MDKSKKKSKVQGFVETIILKKHISKKSLREQAKEISKKITKPHLGKKSFADLQQEILHLRNSYRPHEMPSSEVTKFNKKLNIIKNLISYLTDEKQKRSLNHEIIKLTESKT